MEDTPRATEDSGDLKAASQAGVLSDAKFTTVAQLVAGKVAAPARGMVVFKSIGTALQDLALAAAYYEKLRDAPGVTAAAAFGTTLHVCGPDIARLWQAVEPLRDGTLTWTETAPTLEDVFISLMGTAKDNFR